MNNLVTPLPHSPQSQWKAELGLELAKTVRGTVLKQCRHQGPLYVQKAFYPEGRELAHLYLLHPPGGMVSGDDLHIEVATGPDAQTLITTPGAGRVYRARADKTLQTQRISLHLSAGSSLEWLPLENIIYPGAYTRLNSDIHLAEGARFIGWEVTCLGLQASEQPFEQGQMDQQLQIFHCGRLQLREKLCLDPAHNNLMQSKAGLAGCSVNGLLVAGPFSSEPEALLQTLREQCEGICEGNAALAAVSHNGQFIQVRYLGNCSEQARALFTRCWQQLRPALLERAPCPPRIWAT